MAVLVDQASGYIHQVDTARDGSGWTCRARKQNVCCYEYLSGGF